MSPAEIKKEESEKLTVEQTAHLVTQQQLATERETKKRVQERLYWRCHRRAKWATWMVSGFVGVLLLMGFAAGLDLRPSNPILGWMFTVGSAIVSLFSLGNLAVGTTVSSLHQQLADRCLTYFIKRDATATGLDLEEFQ